MEKNLPKFNLHTYLIQDAPITLKPLDVSTPSPRGRAMKRQRTWCEVVVTIKASSKAFSDERPVSEMSIHCGFAVIN